VFYHGLTADQIYAEKGGVVLAGDVAAAAKV
jgi:hypothetical protein